MLLVPDRKGVLWVKHVFGIFLRRLIFRINSGKIQDTTSSTNHKIITKKDSKFVSKEK